MKKTLYIAAAAMLTFGIAACNKTQENKADEATEEEKTEQVAEEQTADANTGATEQAIQYTPSGLGYQVISEGEGEKPGPTSVVSVYYTGLHMDGTAFDGPHAEPVEFPLNGVIPGFSEGLQLMSPGAHYMLYIPGNLGYGQNGISGVIAPNETLVFDVTLESFR